MKSFKEPVQLSLRMFDIEEAHNPAIYHVDRKKKAFTKTENGSVDDDIVTGYTNHFSEYTILNSGENNKPPAFPSDQPTGGDDGSNGGGSDKPGGKQPTDGNGGNDTPPGTEPTNGSGGNGSGTDSPAGGLLPDTATSMYSILLAGFLISALGTALYLHQRRKQNKANQA